MANTYNIYNTVHTAFVVDTGMMAQLREMDKGEIKPRTNRIKMNWKTNVEEESLTFAALDAIRSK